MARKKSIQAMLSPENEDFELKGLAYKQARAMLEAGNAPPSVLMYFLNKGSTEEQQANRIKEAQISVLEAKAKHLDEQSSERRAIEEAIEAFKSYDYNPYS